MQKLYCLAFLVLGLVAQAQIVNIPDANFKAKLLSASPNYGIASTEEPYYASYSNSILGISNFNVIDTNGDGEIQVSEAQSIKYLSVSDINILDMTGIEAFTNLKYLGIYGTNFSNVNFSGLTNLSFLSIYNTHVTSIDLNNYPNLEYFKCNPGNYNSFSLTSLDLTPAPNLKSIDCSDNQLTTLDVSNLTNLFYLYCNNNNITNLNLSNLSNLREVECYNNSLTNLTLTNVSLLEELNCAGNQLSTLDVTDATFLKFLQCSNNQLVNLNVYGLSYLENLYCNYNLLTNLNFAGNNLLTFLNISHNQFQTLTIMGLNYLQVLDCSHNQLSTLNLTGLNNLRAFSCDNNQLFSLDISVFPNLISLVCDNNSLTNLDFINSNNLTSLSCSNTQIGNLNISNLVNLKSLYCSNCPLMNLNLSNVNDLKILVCDNTQLTSLDISNLVNLENLKCNNNSLVSLDVSNSSNLKRLDCYSNSLESLFAKNSNTEWVTMNFWYNPNLQYICVDEEDVTMVQNKINQLGLNATCHVNSYCSFTPGGNYYTIEGNNRYDFNTNGCDAGDINFANLKLDISNGTTVGGLIADGTGNYFYDVQQGTYTINPVLENPTYFNISPTTVTVNFPTQASPYNQDFCVTKTGVHSDVEIALIPTTPARPGFDATYKLIFRNKGTEVENGSVTLTYDDSVLDYLQSNPVYSNSATNSYTWNYTNLQPFESRAITIAFNVNSPMETPAVNNGDVLVYTATVTTQNTDETPTDNTITLNQTVVGSYDPNDKTCLEGETINPSMIGEYVNYMIRFENTGTYPAENIVVRDDIDPTQFDIATLVPLSGSHEFYTRINGNKVEFIFENINLDFDDATNDGYVAFKIKTLSTLTVNSTISNTAKIYFDYNYPIVTNTATSTYQVLNAQSFEFDSAFTLYPNPAKAVLNLQAKNGTTIQSIEIYNIVGQVVLALPNASSTIDVSSLESGSYFIKINSDNGSTSTKFIKQ